MSYKFWTKSPKLEVTLHFCTEVATLLGSLILFALLPLIPLFLDIVLPLNETRLKQQVFKLNYLVDDDKYFYPIYFHSIWTSTTIVTVMNLNNVREAFRIGIFLGAQQFHLFFNSLPGQNLVDRSLQLLDDLYSSKWYQAPVRMQRVIYMMQIRSGVPCTLTAGGLYNMNIENFGMIIKSCMSYFTMLLSLRE
ncbi:uncharacterized protein LOC143343123 [Colletes latitarsis]|uniref:uncharacterized protein LOC143343123 n=1 Tax=Colletes latitarsis TaxID=2605962 RepID=UPI004037205A